MVSLCSHKQNKGMVEPEQKEQLPVQRPARGHKSNVTHLVEQRVCAVQRIASTRCNLTADIYCQQLRLLADAILEKQPTRLREVMQLHDNARPHSANLT